jgi:hypothetical protein
MQMRVCHTERGTYCAFAKEFGTNSVDGIQKFYVAKIDNDGISSILYYGEFESDDAEITVNVAQDTTGDIFVTAISETFHGVYVFDRDTDQVTKYEMEPEFKAESKLGNHIGMRLQKQRRLALAPCAAPFFDQDVTRGVTVSVKPS